MGIYTPENNYRLLVQHKVTTQTNLNSQKFVLRYQEYNILGPVYLSPARTENQYHIGNFLNQVIIIFKRQILYICRILKKSNLKNFAAASMTAIPASVLWCGELGGRWGAESTEKIFNYSQHLYRNVSYQQKKSLCDLLYCKNN